MFTVLTILDSILLLLDFLGFLLEPVYEKLAKRLNFGRQQEKNCSYSEDAPWLLRNHKVTRSLDGLGRELVAFGVMQRRFNLELNASRGQQQSMIEVVKRTIKTKWPWATLHPASADPVAAGQLNWMDHDLCMIDDWDFPQLPPKLPASSSSSNAQQRDKEESRWQEVYQGDQRKNKFGADNTGSSEDTKGCYNVVVGATATTNGNGGSRSQAACSMRIIYSSSVDRKLFLEILPTNNSSSSSSSNNDSRRQRCSIGGGKHQASNENQNENESEPKKFEAANDHYGGGEQRSTLCIKWLTIDEFLFQEARARLVFYYTQIHPELADLYHVVSSLLDCAQLIESAGGGSAALSQVDRCWPSSLAVNYGQRSSAAAATASVANKTAAVGGGGGGKEQHLLSRYTLVLMLAAYLNSVEALELERRCRAKHLLLAQHLIGFLSAFAYHPSGASGQQKCIYIGPKFTGDGSLEMNRVDVNEQVVNGAQSISVAPNLFQKASGNDVGDEPQALLVVLDPIAQVDNGSSGARDRAAAAKLIAGTGSFIEAQQGESLINLTKNLVSADRILKLFAELGEHLNNNINFKTSASGPQQQQSLLASLFAVCRAKQPSLSSTVSSTNANGRYTSSEHAASGEFPIVRPISRPSSSPSNSGVHHSPTRWASRNFSSGGPNLTLRKILTSFFYLALFLVMRNFLLNYLHRLRADLKEQAREDLLHLKYALFEQPSLQQQRDDDYYGSLNKRLDKEQNNGEKISASFMANGKSFGGGGGGASSDFSDGDDGDIWELDDYEDDDDENDADGEDAPEDLIGNLFASMLRGTAEQQPSEEDELINDEGFESEQSDRGRPETMQSKFADEL